MTLVLQLLGEVMLARGGTPVHRLLAAPKRLGLLTYLALAEPGGLRRRDELAALLWPDRPQPQARSALRNMLYLLRQDVGDHAILSRGDEAVGVARESFDCDVLHVRAALRAERLERAVAAYRGPLLPAFFVPNASAEFDEWLDGERRRLARGVVDAALTLSRRAHRDGDAEGALRWARRCCTLGSDMGEAERWLGMLQAAGAVAVAAAAPAVTALAPVPRGDGAIRVAPSVVAVLPFVTDATDAAADHFADGLLEELHARLAACAGLVVVARSVAAAIQGAGFRLTTLARELGVGTLLEGSVRRSGPRVRVAVRIVDAATGRQGWSTRLDREFRTGFALQDEMAAAIVRAVAPRVAPPKPDVRRPAGAARMTDGRPMAPG